MNKKIKEKDLTKEFKYLVVLRYMLNNPDKHWEYIRLLYAANIISHIMDSILQDLSSKAPYLTEKNVIQRMKNATKAFDGLVDTLLKESKELSILDKYEDVVNVSIKNQELFIKIINDISFWGVDSNNFRWVELNRVMDNIVSKESIEKELEDYKTMLHNQYSEVLEDLNKVTQDSNKKEFMDICEKLIMKK